MRRVTAIVVVSCLGAPSAAAVPAPPRQRDPWTPPATKLPRYLVSAAATLYEQGLADPRGCEYRAVRLASDQESDNGLAAARPPALHAWVIPATGTGPRAAVGWDGLVYTVSVVGPEADVDADVKALVQVTQRERDQTAGRRPRGLFSAGAQGYAFLAQHNDLEPGKVLVLLRLGRADLAESLWSAAIGWTPDRTRFDLASYGVSYLSLAEDWAWALFSRGLLAHAAGDDADALAALRELARISPLIEARAQTMGFPRPHNFQNNDRVMPYLDFLGPAPVLLADQERRAKEPKSQPEPGKIADRDARIAALVRDLDRVSSAYGSGSNIGGAFLGNVPVVKALVKEKDAAVEPLLTCLEDDGRLTRTVDYDTRHGTRHVNVRPVSGVAFEALTQILGTRQFGGDSPAAIRAYWKKSRGLAPEERWYQTLADDNARPRQWLDAAEALSQPSNVQGRGGSYVIASVPRSEVPPLRGEPLRGKKDPSVTDLIARRVEAIDPSDKPLTRGLSNPRGGSGEIFPILEANRMAGFLARWDAAGSLPTLRARVGRCRAIITATDGEGLNEQALKTDLARFTLLAQQAGDPKALDEYADFVRTLRPSHGELATVEVFEPLWRNPDHPALAAAAVALFEDPTSRWVPLFHPRQRGWNDGNFADIINSPLLGVAPFRALVLAGLADKAEVGTIITDHAGKIAIGVDDGWITMPAPPMDDPLRPRASTKMPLRMADLYAWKLEGLGGTPRLEMYWPEAKRDESVAACAAFLRQYGACFRDSEAARAILESESSYPRHQRAVFTLGRLDHPATGDDVRSGRAIFSLDGGEVRRWPMPAFPMPARWTALKVTKDDPGLRAIDLSGGISKYQVQSLQAGRVWQAEEIRERDGWRRYYGFVGPYVLARVPAEEVEFPAERNTGWWEVSAVVDVRIVPPGGRDDGNRIVSKPVSPDGPLPLEVWVRNRRGVDSAVPEEWVRTAGDTSLREGIAVRLFRERERPSPPQGKPRVDDEVSPRSVRRHPAGAPTRNLAPAEAFRAMHVDLKTLFAVDRPGRYRLEVTADDMKDADGTPGVASAYFTLSGSPEGGQQGISDDDRAAKRPSIPAP